MPSLARGLVPFFLMTCAAMELKQDSLIVQVMDLADQTTVLDMLMMLVWRVNHVCNNIVGASLSKPHTSVTAFAEVVCMYVCLWPYTINFK